jgi:hypothetical protein
MAEIPYSMALRINPQCSLITHRFIERGPYPKEKNRNDLSIRTPGGLRKSIHDISDVKLKNRTFLRGRLLEIYLNYSSKGRHSFSGEIHHLDHRMN